jgi:hypothetical protein
LGRVGNKDVGMDGDSMVEEEEEEKKKMRESV